MYAPIHLLTILVVLQGASPVPADDNEPEVADAPQVGASVHAGSISFLIPGRWAMLEVAAFNSRSEPTDLLVTTSFENDDNLQFGRRIWVPANARVQFSHPLLAPSPEDASQQSFKTETLIFDVEAGDGVPLADRFGQRYQSGTFRIGHNEPVTAIAEGELSGEAGVSIADFVIAARYEHNLWRNAIFIGNQALPATETALDGVDHLVLADDRVTRDLSLLRGIRQWLHGGGYLWVMLDQMDSSVLESLLGDRFACAIVDRISLTDVTIESGPDRLSKSEWSTEHEQPVDFVRVVTSGVDLEYTANGWPAAFWVNCGQGRLLVTTLAADAWARPRLPHDPLPSADESHANHLYPGEPLQRLAMEFFVPRPEPPLPPEIAETHIRSSVGYSIPSRPLVLGLLTAFLIALAGMERRMSRSGRLELMGVLGPVAALMIGGILIAAGELKRQAVPPSVSSIQFVQPITGTADVRISATAGIYASESGQTHIAGARGGWALPDMTGMEEAIRRLVWTDSDNWQWEDLPGRPGLRPAVLLESQELSEPVEALFELDDKGVVGRLSLPEGLSAEDGVLVTNRGRIGVQFEDDGTIRAPATQILSDQQFLSATVLTDEQMRRSRTLQAMLNVADAAPFQQPTLLFWTEPWELALQFDRQLRIDGSALVAVPVTLRRPEPGTRVTIPAPLLPYRETIGVGGAQPTGFFDYRRIAWGRKSAPTATWLQFQVPPDLMPIELQSAQLVIQVDGPVGKLDISGADGAEVVPIKTWIDPVGRLELIIDDPRVLSLTDDGRLLLRVAGGDPERPELTRSSDGEIERVSYWMIESLTLELTALVTSRGQ